MNRMTRLEIADMLGDAFGPAGADRAALVAVATKNQADPDVLQRLRTLPDRRFRTMRDLWDLLPDTCLD